MSTHDSKNEDVVVWGSVLGLMERNLSFILGLHPIDTRTYVTVQNNNNGKVPDIAALQCIR
jgi:hypothetical protein